MNTYFKKLMNELDSEISRTADQNQITIEESRSLKMLTIHTLNKLQEFKRNYTFKSDKEEIHYYKNLKPKLVSKTIYYCKVAAILGRVPLGSIEFKKEYFKNELRIIEAFFQTNVQFINQYRARETMNDEQLYLNRNLNLNILPAHIVLNSDHGHLTNGDYYIAELLANEKLQKFLTYKLENIDFSSELAIISKNPNSDFLWTAPKVALIELIYALFSQGAINKGEVEIIHLVKSFEQFFNIELGDPYRMFTEIKQRKKSPTTFLKTLADRLNQYIIEQEKLD